MTTMLYSASPPSLVEAYNDLLDAFGPRASILYIGGDTGRLELADGDITEVAAVCRSQPLVFVQHLMQEIARIPSVEFGAEGAIGAILSAVSPPGALPDLAVQLWQTEDAGLRGETTSRILQTVVAGLRAAGYHITKAGQPYVVSLCLTSNEISVGFNRTSDALSDWPAGHVRLSRRAEYVSRSANKLEEALMLAEIALPTHGDALDLGASPGGWTQVLRQAGLPVWAIDPAELDPRIATDPSVHHVRQTAEEFLRRTRQQFAIIVNDMRMDVAPSCALMVKAATHLEPGGLAIMTLKLDNMRMRSGVKTALGILRAAYTIVFARQLFYNRFEVTIVARRPSRD